MSPHPSALQQELQELSYVLGRRLRSCRLHRCGLPPRRDAPGLGYDRRPRVDSEEALGTICAVGSALRGIRTGGATEPATVKAPPLFHDRLQFESATTLPRHGLLLGKYRCRLILRSKFTGRGDRLGPNKKPRGSVYPVAQSAGPQCYGPPAKGQTPRTATSTTAMM